MSAAGPLLQNSHPVLRMQIVDRVEGGFGASGGVGFCLRHEECMGKWISDGILRRRRVKGL